MEAESNFQSQENSYVELTVGHYHNTLLHSLLKFGRDFPTRRDGKDENNLGHALSEKVLLI
jgi:hypothetical protein